MPLNINKINDHNHSLTIYLQQPNQGFRSVGFSGFCVSASYAYINSLLVCYVYSD